MLEHLHERIVATLNQSKAATLSSCGPLGVQAGRFPCQFFEMRLYLLVPATLDILENLAENPEAVVTGSLWQARGVARVIPAGSAADVLRLFAHHNRAWDCLVRLQPRTIQLQPYAGWKSEETIDFDQERNE